MTWIPKKSYCFCFYSFFCRKFCFLNFLDVHQKFLRIRIKCLWILIFRIFQIWSDHQRYKTRLVFLHGLGVGFNFCRFGYYSMYCLLRLLEEMRQTTQRERRQLNRVLETDQNVKNFCLNEVLQHWYLILLSYYSVLKIVQITKSYLNSLNRNI